MPDIARSICRFATGAFAGIGEQTARGVEWQGALRRSSLSQRGWNVCAKTFLARKQLATRQVVGSLGRASPNIDSRVRDIGQGAFCWQDDGSEDPDFEPPRPHLSVSAGNEGALRPEKIIALR